MDIDQFANLLFASIRAGTPLLICGLGVLVSEKAGLLNLGQEGMMLVGAVLAFICASETHSYSLAIAAGVGAGILASLLFALLTQVFHASQVPVGLVLTIAGSGFSAFLGASYLGTSLIGLPALEWPLLSQLPIIGKGLFQHDILVYSSLVLCALVGYGLYRWPQHLILDAIGESPENAHKLGLPVNRIRLLACCFGGAMAGLAGSYVSLAYSPLWTGAITGGRGWIALALVVFASWRLGRLMAGAYLFGMAGILHLLLQSLGVEVSGNILAMLPYVLTLVALLLWSNRRGSGLAAAPKSLGQNFVPEK